MSRSRRVNPISSQFASVAPTTIKQSQCSSDNTQYVAINTFLALTPLSLFTLFILVLSYGFMQPSQSSNIHAFGSGKYIRQSLGLNKAIPPVPTLNELVADVADALDRSSVTHWLMPTLGLFPTTKQRMKNKNVLGRLNPWQEGVDLGVFHDDVMQILLAQAKLQDHGILAVESYFGLRLFPHSGRYDDRYDFRTPFIDLFYFRVQGNNVTNSCCDCGPVTIGACTKKTCTCLECTFSMDEIFPLTKVQIEFVRRTISAPRNTSALLFSTDLPGVHSEVFKGASFQDAS